MVNRKSISLAVIAVLSVALLLLNGCVPAQEGETGGFNLTAVIMVVVLIALFYLLILRPVRKRQKEQQKLLADLRIGDQVIAAGGIYGIIESMDDESLVIRVESGAKIRVIKQNLMLKRTLN